MVPRLKKIVEFLADRAIKETKPGDELSRQRWIEIFTTEIEERVWDVMTSFQECEDVIGVVESFYILAKGYDPKQVR